MLLKELTGLGGISGDEGRVRDFIKDQIKPYVDEMTVDTMGNLIAFKKGTDSSGKAIGFCAHMDEVGMIVTKITDGGYIKFKAVGNLDQRILLSKRVCIGDKGIEGVMGIKAIHQQTPSERKKVVELKDMYIDIGAKDKEQAEEVVSLGDSITFISDYTEFGNGRVKAKALDDRAGCAALIEAVKGTYKNDLYFCFSTREEIGTRGATIIAHRLQLDAVFIVEGTTAADTPFVEDYKKATRLGEGPAVSLKDNGSISDKRLIKFITDVASEKGIKYQLKRSAAGGNDAKAFVTSGGSCAVATVSLPCRYIHSPVSVADLKDYENTVALVKAIAEKSSDLGGIL